MMDLAEGLVSAVVQAVLANKSVELETLKRDSKKLENVKPPFPRISYEEAIQILTNITTPRNLAKTSAATKKLSSPTNSTAP